MPNLLLGVLRPAILAPAPTGGVAGYFAQGDELDDIFKTNFPTDSWSTFQLLDVHAVGSGIGNAGVAGYVHRGFDGLDESDVMEKVTFPTDSITAILTITSFNGFGFGDPGNIGVWGRGLDGLSPSDTIGVFSFAVDTVTNIDTEVIEPSEGIGGGCDTGVAGYFPRNEEFVIGELLLPTLTATFGVAFTDFPLLETINGTLWVNPGVAMYATRGLDRPFSPLAEYTDTVRKVLLPVDAAMSPGPTLPDTSAFGNSFSNDGVAAYVNRGLSFFRDEQSDEVFRLAYATDTWITTTALPDTATDNAAFANMG